ncbi:MAG: hypothetical protein N2652_05085 [Kiritimatiellae bacterium]|nr:hypothetical protein [Kiritimatiellia bacterium]
MNGDAAILTLDQVAVPGAAARAVSLQLLPGEWARLIFPNPDDVPTWGDVMLGLVEPATGRVEFRGRAWGEIGPEEQAAMRAEVGRVFAGTAWVANLDVDENVLLAALYHGRRPASEWRGEAAALARRFGLAGLPAGRPAVVGADELQRAQWVRALLQRPRLLVLERPLRAAVAAAGEFGEAIAQALRGGAAMVWLEAEGDRPPPSALPAASFEVKL